MNGRSFFAFFNLLVAMHTSGFGGDFLPRDVAVALRSGQRLILYSVESRSGGEGAAFRGYPIAGYTVVTDKPTRERIASTLERDVVTGGGALCFKPHHAIRVISGRTIHDLVICYECAHIHIHTSGLATRQLNISGKTDYLDEILTAAKVRLTPRGP